MTHRIGDRFILIDTIFTGWAAFPAGLRCVLLEDLDTTTGYCTLGTANDITLVLSDAQLRRYTRKISPLEELAEISN